jgi:hypothetical protein
MFPFKGVPVCNTCRKSRVEVTIDQVPPLQRSGIDKMIADLKAAGMKLRQLVHCQFCKEYAVFSDWQAF